MKTSNFISTNEFFNILFLTLFVINKYSQIMYTMPDLSIYDIEIDSIDRGEMVCPEIFVRVPLTYNVNPENPIDEEEMDFHFQEIRDVLQEYFDILINTNRENIRPLHAPDHTKYNPIFITAIEAAGSFMTIGLAYVNTPISYKLMKKQLYNQHQPDIGLL